ncbi:MAG: response regulator [Melioribacter sp.]|uniref:response regulator n=1 Tax=Rosettibacter primus TaxID=3111523 RepID=UPI00247CBDE3|nr:response regulator [Melioribacter sp.]
MYNEINELILKIYELAEFAKRRDKFFLNEVCNFLVKEFNLESAVLFRINENKTLKIIGKPNNISNEFLKTNNFNCNECNVIIEETQYILNYKNDCQIKISEGKLHEACALIKISDSKKFLLKIASKAEIEKHKKTIIENTLHLIGLFIEYWFNRQPDSMGYFPNLVFHTTQELKANASSIINSYNVISENKDTNLPEQLSLIKKNAQSILLNINDLSELSKYESNNLSLNKNQINLYKFINDIVNLFKKRTSKKINFEVDISPELNIPIEKDEQKIKYIISTLLYVTSILTKEGKIFIKAILNQNKKLECTISNEGKNLDADIINNFFEPFKLQGLPEFKNTNLTGLSLTLVQKYINFLGGNITIKNNSPIGIIFNFTINGEKMSQLESTISKLPQPSTKNKVLVIEDDYATSKLLSNYLNKWGYVPAIVSTEEQAFNIINSEPLLAIILDIELSNTNGLELLKKIHENPNAKNVPVIVCSIEPEQQKAFLMGAVEYFIKPINYNYLVEVLTSYKLRKNSTILCVDDDVPTLNLVKQAIESVGFNALAESVSANVMELIKDKDIDLAIIDLDMPAPNGFELIKMIKSDKRFAHLPIIIYTGKENYKEDLYKIEGLFDELLEKRSTNIEDLADVINSMINRYEVPPPAEEVLSKKGVKKILLAEDYKHSQIIVTRLLKKNNFEDIVVVENGEDAVKMAKQEKFDLILMDMQMPIMNGFEATEKIRQMPEYKNVPIIALTAFAMKGDREKCLEVGATDYIPKPIDSKEFIDKIKYYTNT